MPETLKVKMGADIMDGNVTNFLTQHQKAHRTKCGEEAYEKNHHIIVNCKNTACLGARCETCARLRHILYLLQGGCSAGDLIEPSDLHAEHCPVGDEKDYLTLIFNDNLLRKINNYFCYPHLFKNPLFQLYFGITMSCGHPQS